MQNYSGVLHVSLVMVLLNVSSMSPQRVKTVMNNYDIYAASGGARNATMVSIRSIQVNDGKLTLGFNAEVDYASIVGIEVLWM